MTQLPRILQRNLFTTKILPIEQVRTIWFGIVALNNADQSQLPACARLRESRQERKRLRPTPPRSYAIRQFHEFLGRVLVPSLFTAPLVRSPTTSLAIMLRMVAPGKRKMQSTRLESAPVDGLEAAARGIAQECNPGKGPVAADALDRRGQNRHGWTTRGRLL